MSEKKSFILEQQIELVDTDVRAFLLKYFSAYSDTFDFEYADLVSQNLREHPHRMLNTNYIAFYKRMALMAAEYGFPEMGAHFERHQQEGHSRDFMDPRYLLVVMIYLSKINLQSTEQKKSLLPLSRIGPDPQQTLRNILGKYVTPERGTVNLYEVFTRTPGTIIVPSQRDRYGLPLLLPDNELHRQLSDIIVTPRQVDTLSRETFYSEHFHPLQRAFPHLDIASVFFHPKEEW